MKTIVVTRHKSLIQFLIEQKIIDQSDEVVSHATEELVEGNRVIGVLPIHLAALTSEYVNVPIHVPSELRGEELSIEEIRKYAQPIKTYIVNQK